MVSITLSDISSGLSHFKKTPPIPVTFLGIIETVLSSKE
jgi:hypothetical protein